jgi:hypothetical protein
MATIKKDVIKYAIPIVGILAVGALAISITSKFFVEFNDLAWFIVLTGISFGLYSVADNIFLKAFNTNDELRKGNVAYAIKLLGFAIIIAACVSAA